MSILNDFEIFRREADRHGYFVEKDPIKEKDGSFTYEYENGDWKFHDNFFGGEPYGGRVVIAYKNKPYWIMVYYGFVEESVNDVNKIYKALREAVKAGATALVRGPEHFEANGFIYTNMWKGDITRFSGRERIHQGGIKVFQTTYAGGLVDQRNGF